MNFKRIINRIRLFTVKNKEPYLSVYNMTGFYPNDVKLYEQAFMHRSISGSQYGKNGNNERLEFLGDAILDAIIADVVYKYFPDKREGFLTNTRAKIVQRDNLNQVAINLGIDKHVSSHLYVARHHKYINGNALEALIGAIYIDQGYERCCKFVEERIISHLSLDKLAKQEVNFKSRLLEWSQKNKVQADFDLLESFIDKKGGTVFKSGIFLAGTRIATGTGGTKKESQQQAAKKIVYKINRDPDGFMQLIDEYRNKPSSVQNDNSATPEVSKTADAIS